MPAPSAGSGSLIAVLNSSRDLVNLLQFALEQDGFRTISLVSTLTGLEVSMPTSGLAVIAVPGPWSTSGPSSATLRASGRPPRNGSP